VGLLVTVQSRDRPPALAGKDAGLKEYPWYFEGREAKPVTSEARQCSLAVIGGRRSRLDRCGKAH
jgi:hypothetical protein